MEFEDGTCSATPSVLSFHNYFLKIVSAEVSRFRRLLHTAKTGKLAKINALKKQLTDAGEIAPWPFSQCFAVVP